MASTFNESPDSRTVNNFHTNDDVDSGPDSHHHTIGPGTHQAASGAHNHRDGNGLPILDGVQISGTVTGENSAVLVSIISALTALGAEDKTA